MFFSGQMQRNSVFASRANVNYDYRRSDVQELDLGEIRDSKKNINANRISLAAFSAKTIYSKQCGLFLCLSAFIAPRSSAGGNSTYSQPPPYANRPYLPVLIILFAHFHVNNAHMLGTDFNNEP